MKCKKCGLVYSNPQPIPLDINDHYGVDPGQYWNEDYFVVPENHYQDELSVLRKLTGNKKPLRVLDVGAGIGKVMKSLEKEGHDVYGIEASPTFHKAAVEKMGIPTEKIHCVMLEDAEFPDGHFDFINISAVLEHLYDPDACMKKLIRWLKPGGFINIEVPSSNWLMSKIFNLIYKIQGLRFVSNLSPMHNPYHLYEFSPVSFALNGAINNYTISHLHHFVCKTFAPKLLDKPLRRIMRLTKTGMQLMVWVRKSEIED